MICKTKLLKGLYFTFLFLPLLLKAQLVINNGALIAIKNDAIVIVKTGSVNNASGSISNDGDFTIEGNLENNDTITGAFSDGIFRVQNDWINNAFFRADSSFVQLYGADQLITGSAITEFHNLELTGTGVKTQTIDAIVNSVLDLNDRELATDGNKMFVINTGFGAIVKNPGNLGFVSSTGNGRLSRDMAATGAYLFPVGSSFGTPRYRPVRVSTINTLNQTIEVRFANVDATTEGFDRNVKEIDICDINPLYYHLVGRTVGVDPVDIDFTFDPAADGNFSEIAHWQNLPQWELVGPAIPGTFAPFSTLSLDNWSDFTTEPYAYAIPNPLLTAVVDEPNCFDAINGSIDVTVTNGTGSIDYNWTPNIPNVNGDLLNIGAGTYTLQIEDDNGCTVEETFTLTEPDEIQLSALVTEPTCAGSNDGEIDLTVTGAQPQVIDYSWSDDAGINTEDRTGVEAGDVTVEVIDGNGCQKSLTLTITEPDGISAEFVINNVSCFGEADGSIDMTATGGTGTLTYNWDGSVVNDELEDQINLLPGTNYAVVITDQNNCKANFGQFTISQPDPVSVLASQDTTIAKGFSAGISVLQSAGGIPEYSFVWSLIIGDNDASIIPEEGEFTNVSPAFTSSYLVEMTDSNGCKTSDTVLVKVDVKLYQFPNAFTPNGGPDQVFKPVLSSSVSLVKLQIFNRWGQIVYDGSTGWDGTKDGEVQPVDNYVYQAVIRLPDGKDENVQGDVILVQ